MEITPIPCLTDNYAYIIYDNNSKTTGVVDPSESQPIISFLKRKNIKLNYILNTHHHFDHIGGNIELKKKYNAKIVGFAGDKHRIPGIDITLKNNEKWTIGRVIVTPHAAWYSPDGAHDAREKAAKTIIQFLADGVLKNCINQQFLKTF